MNTIADEYAFFARIHGGQTPDPFKFTAAEKSAAFEWLRGEALEKRNPDWRKAATLLQEISDPCVSRVIKNAYYAGAEAVLRILWNASKDPKLSEAAGAAILEGLHQECRLFAREYGLQRGLPKPLVEEIAGAFPNGPRS